MMSISVIIMMMMIQRPDCSLSSPRSLFVSPLFIYPRPTVCKMMMIIIIIYKYVNVWSKTFMYPRHTSCTMMIIMINMLFKKITCSSNVFLKTKIRLGKFLMHHRSPRYYHSYFKPTSTVCDVMFIDDDDDDDWWRCLSTEVIWGCSRQWCPVAKMEQRHPLGRSLRSMIIIIIINSDNGVPLICMILVHGQKQNRGRGLRSTRSLLSFNDNIRIDNHLFWFCYLNFKSSGR